MSNQIVNKEDYNKPATMLKFSRDWRKLGQQQFTCVRRYSRAYRVGRIYLCQSPAGLFLAKLVKIEHMQKWDITDEFAQADCETNRWGMINILEKIYGRKETHFLVLTLNRLDAVLPFRPHENGVSAQPGINA